MHGRKDDFSVRIFERVRELRRSLFEKKLRKNFQTLRGLAAAVVNSGSSDCLGVFVFCLGGKKENVVARLDKCNYCVIYV